MTKLIDLTHRKASTDLLVDCALVAVWYGFPEASRLLLAWLRHRTDDSAATMWTEALRCMRFEAYDEAEVVLRRLLENDPQDAHAAALLVCVLDASGQYAASEQLGEQLARLQTGDAAQALVQRVRALRAGGARSARPAGQAASVMMG